MQSMEGNLAPSNSGKGGGKEGRDFSPITLVILNSVNQKEF